MNSDDNICREGVVKDISDGEVLVEIIVSSACSGCSAKSICIPSERREERIWAKNPENIHFEMGETVNLQLASSAGNRAVLLAYVLPLVILTILLLVTYFTTKRELLSIFVSFLGVVLYYLILKNFSGKIEKKMNFYVTKK